MIYDREQDMMLACGTTVGVSICLAGWLWMPENWFQAMVTIREYAYVTLVGITVFSWIWLRWIRPIPVALMMPAWCWWVIFRVDGGGGNGRTDLDRTSDEAGNLVRDRRYRTRRAGASRRCPADVPPLPREA